MNNQDGIKNTSMSYKLCIHRWMQKRKKRKLRKISLCTQTHKLRLNPLMCAVCRLLDNLKEGSTKKKKNIKMERAYGDISVQKKDTHRERHRHLIWVMQCLKLILPQAAFCCTLYKQWL